MKTPNLSKSSFASGLQCHRRLWIEKRQPELVPPTSLSQQAIFDQGHEVGSWSHKLFPDGILLSGELDFKKHLEASRDALNLRKPLFEPAFSIEGAYARADILVPVESNGWDLLEVKSSSNVWDDNARTQIKSVYLQDIAFQMYVYRQAGLEIRRAYLVFLNSAYVRNGEVDPQRLFRREEVTAEAEALVPIIPIQLAKLAAMLQHSTAPQVEIGPYCSVPYSCSLMPHCWKQVPENSVFSLTHAGAKAWKWWNYGIIRVTDLPSSERYSANQSIQIAAERTDTPYMNAQAVQQFLAGLVYPLYYLDFETIMPAVPMFDGCRPYAQVPFQFSLHFQPSAGAEIDHFAYLADGVGDPRPGLLKALRSSLGSDGAIVSYNSHFEMSRLREMASQFPEHAAWINQALVRFQSADLLQPFRSFALYHPRQHGSASIKAVLPAFTDLSYEDLTIQEGGAASNQFLGLLKGLVPNQEISKLRDSLSKYCERDTLAMVKLIERLQLMVASQSRGEFTAYSLQEYGITEPIKLLGKVTKLLPLLDVPIVFLIDEAHETGCINQNIANANVLIQHCNIGLIGVESHSGGLKWDDCFHHKYTLNFDPGESPVPVSRFPHFAEALNQTGAKVLGVECQGLSNELECSLVDHPNDGPIQNRPFNVQRSKHFIRTLFELRQYHNLAGNVILNVGGNHNTHIANWIIDGSIETKAGQRAAYVRLRSPLYCEQG